MSSNSNISRLKLFYNNELKAKMMKEFGFKNIHEVPQITKVVLSMGLNKNRDATKNLDDLTRIAGQKALITKARKSISQFGLREGFNNGAMVTVRNNNMFHLLDRIINIALLNWRSCPGLSLKSFNTNKVVSYSFGIPDKRIFAEVTDESIRNEGLNITIVSTCSTKEQMEFIMRELGFPFRKN